MGITFTNYLELSIYVCCIGPLIIFVGVQIGIDGIDNSRSNENGSGLVEGDDNGSAFALNSITEESEPLNNDSVFVVCGNFVRTAFSSCRKLLFNLFEQLVVCVIAVKD